MMIILFLITSALLVEVGGKKYTADLETANAILILTAAELDSSENSKLTGLIRFPKSTNSGNKSDTPPTSTASKGHGRSSFHKHSGFTTHGFKPSYGNGIASLSSMDFLYGNRILTGQHPMSKTRTHILASKSDAPQGKQSNKENNYLGYYDHHHYHYVRDMVNGKSHDRRPLSVSPHSEIQHEPEVIGEDFHGNFNGHNHNHLHDQRNNNHNGHNNHNQGNYNGGDGGGNGYFYHGHYGPDGVAHFHSGNQNGHGYRNGGNSYTYSSGDGYNYYYNNGDGNGNGYYYYHNGPQGEFHHQNNDIQRPHHQDLPQNIHSGDNFGPEGQGNGFNSHGAIRPPGNYDGNVDLHNHGENLNAHGPNQHFDGGPNHDRFPPSNVEQNQEHLDFRHPAHNNFRGPEGPFNNNGHHEFQNGQPFRLPHDSPGSRFPEQDFRHNHNERFRQESNTPAGHKIEEIFHSPTYVPQNQAHIIETYPEDNNNAINIGSSHVHDAELILNNRLQNPKINDLYFNFNRETINNREYQDSHRFHRPEFRPSEPFDVEGFRYGEPGNSFNTMHPRRRYYSPTFSSGDYGHRVYYGNFVGYKGNEDSLENGYGYAKRFGYGNTREHSKEI